VSTLNVNNINEVGGVDAVISAGVLDSGSLPTGSVLQVVSATYSTQVISSSGTLVSTPLTLSITPSSASSDILVMLYVSALALRDPSTNAGAMQHAIDRDGSVIIQTPSLRYQDNADTTGRSISYPVSLNVLDSPATTSAVTYTHQHRNADDSVRSFSDNSLGTLIAMEIAG